MLSPSPPPQHHPHLTHPLASQLPTRSISMSTSSTQVNVLLVGGSRNIGYLTGLRLLKQGHIVTYLLRNPNVFDADEEVQQYVKTRQARLLKGDSLNEDDVRRAWEEAGKGRLQEGYVDYVISTVGGGGFSLTRGVFLDPPDLCTRAMRTLLAALPHYLRAPGAQPRIIAVSSSGLGEAGNKALPLVHRIAYPLLIDAPHRDKLGLEVVLSRASGHLDDWMSLSQPIAPDVLSAGWDRAVNLPGAGELPNAVLVRPAWLTDGPATEKYRVVDGQGDRKCKTVSRNDVAHFIAEQVVPRWEQWKGKAVTLAN